MEEQQKEDIKAEIEDNYRFNFGISICEGAFYTLGMGLVAVSTILPLFVRRLTESRLLISLITAIFMFGLHFPQLFSARLVETAELKKKYVLLLGLFQRLPWLFLTLLTYFLFPERQLLLLISFFVLWSVHTIFSGLVGPPWFDMTFKVIPQEKRGRFFGYRSFVSSALEVAGAFLAGYIIKNFSFQSSFIWLFGLTFAVKMLSYLFVALIKEPEYTTVEETKGFKEYFQHLKDILKEKANYRNYVIGATLIQFINMSNGLFTVAGIERLNLEVELAGGLVGIFTIVSIASKSLTNILWGYLGDNWGHKRVIWLASLFNAAAVSVAYFAQDRFLFYVVFILTGIALGGLSVSFMTIIADFAPSLEERPTYVGLTNTVIGLTVTIITLLGGFLADIFNFRLVFAISLVMIILGVVVLVFKVKDPRIEESSAE
ncbi:MFS transporter [Fuchsiella alkaliacetigena]|uniref:MFS transporter n=1 Tax=Fuchsiella alkaliacetigena TaxID=957042 RepID=UPI00200A4B01|nr:MFS transporter [Fuchsiella alkaliacetigena]MCK8825666.1 MFS transporter [Fuchsiella alkaliacetigena]